MAKVSPKPEKQGVSIGRIASALVFLIVLIVYTVYHANFVTGRSLMLAFPGWEVTYRGCWPNPFGGAWVSDVTLMPYEGDTEESFHFENLNIDVPFFQYYASGFSRKRGSMLRAIKDIRLEFSGGQGNMGETFTGEMAVFGNASAAPFEAEGCAEDAYWTSEVIPNMGLETEPTELLMAWHLYDGRLIKEQAIHVPGAGRVDFREEQIRHDNFPLFSLIESDDSELASREWHVKDEGFNAARNQYCASKDGISKAVFVERHLATVQRLLAAAGLKPEPAIRDAYRRYAESGEPLDLVLNFEPPIGGDRYSDSNLGSWLIVSRGGFQREGRSLGLGMRAITPRDLPEDEDAVSTWALLTAEGGAELPIAGEALSPQAAPAPAPTIAVAMAPPPEPAAAPDPAAQKNADWLSTEPADSDPDSITRYAELAKEIGHRLVIHLKDKPPIQAEIIGSENGIVRVRRQMRTGVVEHDVAPASFERATRLN